MRYVHHSEMASLRNIGLNNEEKKAEHERNQAATPNDSSSNIHNKTPPRESYWFAHGGVENVSAKNAQNSSKPSAAADAKEAQLQKDKEERIKFFREHQEEERVKKLKDLEQQFLQAKKHREQQEEERKRRIEEARIKEMERRQQVEERKRQIWEAEQERKEAILRRNMEREARIEARRNAQRMSQSFAFGSSTPRTFDLDLAAIGIGRNSTSPGSVLMSSVSGRRSEERELGVPRSTSACSLDKKFETISHDDYTYDQQDFSRSASLEPSPGRISNLSKQIALQHKSSDDMKACLTMWDNRTSNHPYNLGSLSSGWLVGSGVFVGEDCMSRSMVSLSSSAFRGRKRTDITPILTRERSITPHVTPRGNHSMRAVSMTRLDQLAQPRRPYCDTRLMYGSPTTTSRGPRASSPSMTKSMVNLANSSSVNRRVHACVSYNRKGNMSQSMMHLADTPQKDSRQLTPSPTVPKTGMRSARSMMHLAAPPRLTRTARLRAQAALASSRASSAWNLSKPDISMSGQYLTPGKDTSRSPSRPQSSLSGASELSATSSSISAVNMRTRSAPRRPRPYSIAGTVVDRNPPVASAKKETESQRQPRPIEKNAQSSVTKAPRAKSVGREKSDVETQKPLSAPKKPVPPPKSKEVLARAKSHPVPIKDNLRKNVKQNVAKVNGEKQPEEKGSTSVEQKENIVNTVIKSPVESKSDIVNEIVNSSPITSPVTDSDMCISFEDSRPLTESDYCNYTQTFTESESKTEHSESTSIAKEKIEEQQKVITPKESIPAKSEEKNKEKIEEQKVITPKESIPAKSEEKDKEKIEEQKVITPKESILPKSEEKDNIVSNNRETVQVSTTEVESPVAPPLKPRITSEEEARAALAEKRRLAREQAEREAELERQRQEELRRQEEERKRIEEEKQREFEEEQIRLAELHRQLEAEKLRKAIEEKEQKEKEEREKQEEEAKLKAEKEEQERKAREEAEKQRLELEERLRKEEEERAERKKRVEQIMARTRAKSAAQTPPATTPVDSANKFTKTEGSTQSNNSVEITKANVISPVQDAPTATPTVNGSSENHSVSPSVVTNNFVSSADVIQNGEEKKSNASPLPDLLNTNNIANHSVKSNGHHTETDEQFSSNISVSNSFNLTSSRTLSANDAASPTQTNGYNSHEDMSCTTSPEDISNSGLLIDIGSSQPSESKINSQPTDFTKLVDIETSSLNINNDNYLINVDNVNSNILSTEKPYSGFDDCLQKKSDSAVADLLS